MADTARPLSEWHEDMGPVLWWAWPITEAPYIGTPLDLPQRNTLSLNGREIAVFDTNVGWPGYHTHWTPLPAVPVQPST